MPSPDIGFGSLYGYKQQYDRLMLLIIGIEQRTDDWDTLCECEPENGCHSKDCLTSQIRLDIAKFR